MASPQIEDGHLDLANELVEVLAKTYLSPNESQILWAVWRKTYCWHKKKDWIAYKQFRDLTGMIDPNINKILKRLVYRRILIRIDKSYSFNKNYEEWLSKPISKLSKQISGVIQIDKKKLSKQIDTNSIPKETLTKETTTIVVDDYITFKEIWKKVYGKYPTGGRILVDFPIKRLVKAYGIQEVCSAIIWAEKKRKVCDYIPSFNNPLDLERKWNSLINQYRKEQNAKDYIIDLDQV